MHVTPLAEPDPARDAAAAEPVPGSAAAFRLLAERLKQKPKPPPAPPAPPAPPRAAEPAPQPPAPPAPTVAPILRASPPVRAEIVLAVPAPAEPRPDAEAQPNAVVAMLESISAAIYAKPTAEERAAFLRDVAPPAPVFAEEPQEEEKEETEPAAEEETAAAPQPAGEEYSLPEEPAIPEMADADTSAGETTLKLLDMILGGTGTLPQERALAADTLIPLLPRIPARALKAVVERVAIMERPPPLLVAKLLRDPRPEILAPLLERCSQISDQELIRAAGPEETAKLRMIASRRIVSSVLADHLVASGARPVLLALLRNPGADLSAEGFERLAEAAARWPELLAPLATRPDLPPAVAFELFWSAPAELRRHLMSRFLTDSGALARILAIALGPRHSRLHRGMATRGEVLDAAIGEAAAFRLPEAARRFAMLAGIAEETALRALSDRGGEPLVAMLKASGVSRARFASALAEIMDAGGVIDATRSLEELQIIFDGLSYTKARMLLTYWDWFMRKAGPYAPLQDALAPDPSAALVEEEPLA